MTTAGAQPAAVCVYGWSGLVGGGRRRRSEWRRVAVQCGRVAAWERGAAAERLPDVWNTPFPAGSASAAKALNAYCFTYSQDYWVHRTYRCRFTLASGTSRCRCCSPDICRLVRTVTRLPAGNSSGCLPARHFWGAGVAATEPSGNGTPSSMSFEKAAAKSLKKASSSFAYCST